MSIKAIPSDIRDRAIRRTGRVVQALNSLHDVLQAYPDETFISQFDYEQMMMEIEDKLNDMKRIVGKKPIPFNAKTKQLRAYLDRHYAQTEEGQEAIKGYEADREKKTRARKPSRPRLPRKREYKHLTAGTGLEFDTLVT